MFRGGGREGAGRKYTKTPVIIYGSSKSELIWSMTGRSTSQKKKRVTGLTDCWGAAFSHEKPSRDCEKMGEEIAYRKEKPQLETTSENAISIGRERNCQSSAVKKERNKERPMEKSRHVGNSLAVFESLQGGVGGVGQTG